MAVSVGSTYWHGYILGYDVLSREFKLKETIPYGR